MILLEHQKSHFFIGKEIEMIESKWKFHLEERDIQDKTKRCRFEWIDVDQRKKVNPPKNPNEWQVLTWFKGSHTNTFSADTKDKDKQMIVEMVTNFLLANDYPIISEYIDPRIL